MAPRLFCYVDETGQDTRGRLFIVSIVVTAEQRDQCLAFCESIEQSTGKRKFKWGKAESERRLEYLRRVIANPRFHGSLRYAIFRQTFDYDQSTILAIGRALRWQAPQPTCRAIVYVDGLARAHRSYYSRELRRIGVPTRKVQGVSKDENNALTRLADAVAGFVRDVLEGQTGSARTLFNDATTAGVLVEV